MSQSPSAPRAPGADSDRFFARKPSGSKVNDGGDPKPHRLTPFLAPAHFIEGKPWLLRFFDQIRFYEVSAAELLRLREDFPRGRFKLRTEETTLRLRDYHAFLRTNADSITAFKTHQQRSFEEERHRWEVSGQLYFSAESESASPLGDAKVIPDGHTAIVAHVPGNVWKVSAQVGQRITADQPVVILESMKMEISVSATGPGEITEVFCAEGRPVQAGDVLMVFKPDA